MEKKKNKNIVVIDYGMGNIHSILKALELFTSQVSYTKKIEKIQKADAIVLPGDGAFASAMQALQKNSLLSIIQKSIAQGKSFLGICIGFQVLFENSDENGSLTEGLSVFQGKVRKFSFQNDTRIPHMGWNKLIPQREYIKARHMYFIHSYRALDVPKDLVLAYCNYGGDIFPAIVGKDKILGMQFHPEKSGVAGLEYIKNWVNRV